MTVRFRQIVPVLAGLALVLSPAFFSACSLEDGDGDGDGDDRLLQRFQPILVQSLASRYDTLPYPAESDLIGMPTLHPGDGTYEYTLRIDTDRPVMFTDARTVKIGNRDHTQLLYACFYPERPVPIRPIQGIFKYLQMWFWSGPIDGKVIRVTLDEQDEFPLFIEVLQPCGCAWQLHVNELVDEELRLEYAAAGQIYPGLVKPLAPRDEPYVFIMPRDLDDVGGPVVIVADHGWTESAHHTIGAYTSYDQWLASGPRVDPGILYLWEFEDPGDFDDTPLPIETFDVMDYDVLYDLRVEGTDQPLGIFDDLEYVWNAYPPFSMFIWPVGGTNHPGTPKDLDHLEVVHERFDFWDVTGLLEVFIRLPGSIFDLDD